MTPTEELVRHEPGLTRLIQRIEESGSLPTIPVVAQHAMRLARDENSSMRQIAEVIAQDQALATKVLKIVNSAYYGLRESVGTLPLALTILGVREITQLVLGVSVMSAFPHAAGDELFNPDALWRASARCAHAAKRLAHAVGLGRLASEAFLGGLVHDIGLVVMHQYAHDELLAALGAAKREGIDPVEAERKYLEATHAGVGAWLSDKWAFPAPLVEAIASHHTLSEAPEGSPLAALVHVADLIVRLLDEGHEPKHAAAALEADPVWTRLMDSGPPVRRPSSLTKLLEDVANEIEAAPLILSA